MIRSIAFLPFLAAAAAAQDDDYRPLRLGDRIQITFHSGNTLTGNLVAPPVKPDEKKVDKVDFIKAIALTLNISWEYPGLNGTMTIRKDQIKSVRKLRALDEATIKRLKQEIEKAKADLIQREGARQAAAAKRIQEAEKASAEATAQDAAAERGKSELKRIDDLRKGLEVLAKFPPPAWGPHKLQEIQAKNLNRLPMTLQEREFVQNIELWMLGYNYRKSREAATGGEKTEGGTTQGGTTQPPIDD